VATIYNEASRNLSGEQSLDVDGGWAFVRTWPHGDFPAKAPFPEHRFYEQALTFGFRFSVCYKAETVEHTAAAPAAS
jgi:hypothetical protein